MNAGHPPPLLLRKAKAVKTLNAVPAPPLGVLVHRGELSVGEEYLEPGDLLLFYTDGLPEARQPNGEFLTVNGLAELVEREAAAGQPAPETLRRLRLAVLAHQDGLLQDDATALLVEWNRGTENSLLPQGLT